MNAHDMFDVLLAAESVVSNFQGIEPRPESVRGNRVELISVHHIHDDIELFTVKIDGQEMEMLSRGIPHLRFYVEHFLHQGHPISEIVHFLESRCLPVKSNEIITVTHR